MHAFAAATLASTRRALAELREAVASMPDNGLDWTPMPGLNSVNVLVEHSLTATDHLFAAAAGLDPDREEYLSGTRAESFKTRGLLKDRLLADIDGALDAYHLTLASASDESLAATMSWAFPDGAPPTGAELLVHAVGHLREHSGQVQMTRDLWLSASREGR
jgi:hypothetical protein